MAVTHDKAFCHVGPGFQGSRNDKTNVLFNDFVQKVLQQHVIIAFIKIWPKATEPRRPGGRWSPPCARSQSAAPPVHQVRQDPVYTQMEYDLEPGGVKEKGAYVLTDAGYHSWRALMFPVTGADPALRA